MKTLYLILFLLLSPMFAVSQQVWRLYAGISAALPYCSGEGYFNSASNAAANPGAVLSGSVEAGRQKRMKAGLELGMRYDSYFFKNQYGGPGGSCLTEGRVNVLLAYISSKLVLYPFSFLSIEAGGAIHLRLADFSTGEVSCSYFMPASGGGYTLATTRTPLRVSGIPQPLLGIGYHRGSWSILGRIEPFSAVFADNRRCRYRLAAAQLMIGYRI